MMEQQIEQPAAWHLDKRVPIALIATLAIQTAGMVWWAASITGRVDGLSQTVDEFRAFKTSERLPVLEEQIRNLKKDVEKLDGKIDELLRRTR
jgi:hypothetical protein